ncbi:MAG: nicotinate-nucleotide adenylyltransferase [Alphaproteobacteria bacterium]|nr:nicotinate-nucleotide adenylyltransferase [Alphaproteobacteria bacterium]
MMQRATARNAPAKRPVRRAPADREALALRPGAPRIGLLGGSFNPAHDGHLHLSRLAIRHLGLHELWWLVTPQNPLKPVRGMAPLPARLAAARALARDPRIRVTDIEKRLGTRFTLDTVRALKRRFPRAHFVLVIGADNFIQLPKWRGWMRLMREVPVAVFDRPSYSDSALDGAVAERFARRRIDPEQARGLAYRKPPAWVFFRTALHPSSSTALRQRRAERERRMRLGEGTTTQGRAT